ncbi:hypothetical protein ACFQU2_24795 [Siccirubricoccus deserti]
MTRPAVPPRRISVLRRNASFADSDDVRVMPVSEQLSRIAHFETGAEQQVMVPLQRLAIAASVRDEVTAVEAAGPRRAERR